MTIDVGMLGLCLRVAGTKWGMVLPGVPLEDVQDIAPCGSRYNDFGCYETLIHSQDGVVEHHWDRVVLRAING